MRNPVAAGKPALARKSLRGTRLRAARYPRGIVGFGGTTGGQENLLPVYQQHLEKMVKYFN